MDDLPEFAGLLVDEMIAELRARVHRGEALTLFEQKCVIEQLVKERGRASNSKEPQDGQ